MCVCVYMGMGGGIYIWVWVCVFNIKIIYKIIIMNKYIIEEDHNIIFVLQS